VFAAAWQLANAGAQHVWAALDCPVCASMNLSEAPFEGPCVVMAWREAVDRARLHAASGVYGADGVLAGAARATWIRS
jgi:hypothetical protein